MRFPGFKDDWERRQLGELGEIVGGLTYSPDEIDEDGVLVLRSSNIQNRMLDFEDNVFVKTSNYNAVLENDILICVRNGSQNLIGKNALIKKENEGLAFGAFMTVYRSNYNKFLFHWFDTDAYKSEVYKNLGATINSINGSDLKKFMVPFPSKAEQAKIASFLSLLDDRIATQNKIIEGLKLLKSKIVDKLFSPFETKNPIRFSEFSEDWQAYSYSQILEVNNERNTDNSVTNILSASQAHGMIERDKIDIDIKFDKSSTKTYKIVHPGDYVVHLRSFQGGFAFAKQKGICSPAYTILRPKPMLEFSFLTEYFASEKFIQQLKMVTYGIRDGRSINVEDFLKLHILLPSRQEQKKLKSVIAVLNDKLFQSDALLSLLQSQKKYLLRHLFI